MFVSLLHRVGTLQVNRILIFIGNTGREIIESFYPPVTVIEAGYPSEQASAACRQTLLHRGGCVVEGRRAPAVSTNIVPKEVVPQPAQQVSN